MYRLSFQQDPFIQRSFTQKSQRLETLDSEISNSANKKGYDANVFILQTVLVVAKVSFKVWSVTSYTWYLDRSAYQFAKKRLQRQHEISQLHAESLPRHRTIMIGKTTGPADKWHIRLFLTFLNCWKRAGMSRFPIFSAHAHAFRMRSAGSPSGDTLA